MIANSFSVGAAVRKIKMAAAVYVGLAGALASAPADVRAETAFTRSATSFYAETTVFGEQSKLLINNTNQIHSTLQLFENTLVTPHQLATALKQLDDTLATLKQMIVIAEQVPQTREQAQKFEQGLDTAKTPVHSAAITTENLATAVEPVRQTVHAAETTTAKLIDQETALQKTALAYIAGIEALIRCAEARQKPLPPELMRSSPSIKLIDGSTIAFHQLDEAMQEVNQKYAETVGAPAKAVNVTVAEISMQIKQLEQILSALQGLQNRLQPLNSALGDLRAVLDKSIGVTLDYPCGVNICHKEVPYPCGVKICHKEKQYPCPKYCHKKVLGKKIKYICGKKTCSQDTPYTCAKMCSQDTPYTCGVKTCSQGISISVGTAINGADAIEKKIESLLSSTAWQALTTIGVKKYVDMLQNQANGLVNPVLARLDLNSALNLPDLNIQLNTAVLNKALQELQTLDTAVSQFGTLLDINGQVFAPHFNQLKLLENESLQFIKLHGCSPNVDQPWNDLFK